MSEMHLARAKALEQDTVRILCDLVRTPSFSSKEKDVIEVIRKEMDSIGCDEVRIDGIGSIIGRIGHGPRVIAFDAHIDTVYAGDGTDTVYGGGDGDLIYGGNASDTLYGDTGNDALFGGTDNTADTLYGGDNDDTLDGGLGSDRLYGGNGNDLIFAGAFGNPDADRLDGGAGQDTVDFSQGKEGVHIVLDVNGNDVFNPPSGNNDVDTLVGIEHIIGTNYDDAIAGNASANMLYGGANADLLSGGAADDTLYGGTQDDTLNGDAGADLLYGGDGDDILVGDFGDRQARVLLDVPEQRFVDGVER